jgi:hypothetical protein
MQRKKVMLFYSLPGIATMHQIGNNMVIYDKEVKVF